MKKLFTLAAAVLASLAMMAQTTNTGNYSTQVISADGTTSTWTFILPSSQVTVPTGETEDNGIIYAPSGSSKMKFSSGNQFSWQGTSSAYIPVPAGGAGTITMTVKGSSDSRWLQLFVNGTEAASTKRLWSKYNATPTDDGKKGPQSFAFTADDLTTKDGETYLHFKDNNTEMKIASFEIELTSGSYGAPVTTPVTTVTVSGPTSTYLEKEITLTAVTDVKADTMYWTVDGTVVEGETTKTFKFTPTAERTYQITAWAKNSYNSDWVSGSISVVATVKPVLAQVSVDASTIWDFTKAAAVNEIKWEGAQKDAEPTLLANVDDFNNDADFNSQALLFSGEYPIRDGKYCQGQSLAFTTIVPGILEVVYSNTGNRTAEDGETEGQEALRRFLTINGNLVSGDAGSMTSKSNTTTSNIPVAVGDVVISGVMPYSEEPTKVQYLRIYKVTFQQTGWPTAIDNTNDEVKAVKIIRDGQLFIEKNGVLYNAQGAVVK